MSELLWLIPASPYAAFVLLALVGRRLPKWAVAVISCGAGGFSAVLTILSVAALPASGPPVLTQVLWRWMDTFGFNINVGLYLDPVSSVMSLVVTVVGSLILLYSTRYMEESEGYSRFFAYMELFIGSMLMLVLADNLVLLYLGWEGVGLCSYLLIGFWYTDPANGHAARKAFVVTRVGDAALALGLFLIFQNVGTLNIQLLMERAAQSWATGSSLATGVAFLVLIGAMGKSAQLPLQTWLPDAMAGPTPVSALIHAATMVTAGVYLIARTHILFQLAPAAMEAVAITGAATLLMAGFAGLAQRDIKRVLAYSTISQIGYMFLGLGVGSWTAALFHFVTHACFKSLLFLGAGVVIASMHEEHDIFKMGGLRKRLPVTFWTFLIASASLSAFPLVTGGFYSKDLILWKAWSSPVGGPALWAAGAFGALLTGMYTFRMVFVAFFGELKSPFEKKTSIPVLIPLVVLAALSVLTGYLETPGSLGGIHLFSNFLGRVLPTMEAPHAGATELLLQVGAAGLGLLGIFIVYLLYVRVPRIPESLTAAGLGRALREFWFAGWGFDWLYDRVLVRPYMALAHVNRGDVVDLWPTGLARLSEALHVVLHRTQSGKLRWYTTGIVIGAISGIIVLLVIL